MHQINHLPHCSNNHHERLLISGRERSTTMDDFDSFLIGQMGDFQPIGHPMVGDAASSAGGGMMMGGGVADKRGGLEGPGSQLSSLPFKSSSPAISSPSQQHLQHQHHHQPSHSPPPNMYGMGPPSTGLNTTADPFGDLLTDFWVEQDRSQGGSPSRSSPSAAPDAAHPDRLLSFRTHPSTSVALFDVYNQPLQIQLAAQLHGMFFLAESPWDAAGNVGGSGVGGAGVGGIAGMGGQPKELTCYRRNLFQISGTVTIPRIHSVIVGCNPDENGGVIEGKKRQIQALEATISGIESVEGNSVKIITVPWKSAATAASTAAAAASASGSAPAPSQPNAGGQQSGEDFPATPARAAEKEPTPIFLNYTPAYHAGTPGGGHDDDSEPFSYPLNWKRLQFRSATANNGRRKDLQQHFLVRISIVATLFPENGAAGMGEKVSLCEAFSGAIIVRGRSPRNFSSRNDIPLSGSAASSARQSSKSETTGKRQRHHSSNQLPPFDGSPEKKPTLHRVSQDASASPYAMPHQHQDLFNPAVTQGLYSSNLWAPETTDWMQMNTAALQQQQQMKQEGDEYSGYNFDQQQFGQSPRISVSGMLPPGMSSEEYTTNPRPRTFNSEAESDAHHRQHRPPPPKRLPSMASPSMDLLYEYFPIGVDDWLPPVDVVYRPHAAHHTTQVATKGTGRSKRLFSETPFE